MKTKRSQNWLFSFKGGDEAWQCWSQERQATSLSGSPSAMLRGLDCILTESGAPRHTLCYSHAKLCLVPRPLQVLSQLSAIVCLASSAPHASPTWRNRSHCSQLFQLTTWNYFYWIQHGYYAIGSHEEMLWDQTREACYSVDCSDVQKSLSFHKDPFYMGTKGMFSSTRVSWGLPRASLCLSWSHSDSF